VVQVRNGTQSTVEMLHDAVPCKFTFDIDTEIVFLASIILLSRDNTRELWRPSSSGIVIWSLPSNGGAGTVKDLPSDSRQLERH